MPGCTLETRDWRRPHRSAQTDSPSNAPPEKVRRRPLAGLRDWLWPTWIRLGLRPRHWPQIREAIGQADYVLIGGGELLQETPCHFADHIAAIAREAARVGTPIGFLACGVEPDCTSRSRRLTTPALRQAGLITVRDDASRRNLASWAPGLDLDQVVVGSDPALLVSRAYPVRADEGREGIGVNVVAYESVSRRREIRVDSDRFCEWYLEVIRSMRRIPGHPVILFSNGAPPDASFAAKLHGILDDPSVILVDRPRSVNAFVPVVRECRAVVAARLHTTITAVSYGVPCLATAWSPKFDAFYFQMNRSERLFRLGESPANHIAEAMRSVLSRSAHEGLDAKCVASAYAHLEAFQKLLT